MSKNSSGKKPGKIKNSLFFSGLQKDYGNFFFYKVTQQDIERRMPQLFRDLCRACIDLKQWGDYFHMGFPHGCIEMVGIPRRYNSFGQEIDLLNGEPYRDINGNFIMRPERPEPIPPFMVDLSRSPCIAGIAYKLACTKRDINDFYRAASVQFIYEQLPGFDPAHMENCKNAVDLKTRAYSIIASGFENFLQRPELMYIQEIMIKLSPYRHIEL